MPLYLCEWCNYKTHIKTHYNRHQKTKKHIRNLEVFNAKNDESINPPHKPSICEEKKYIPSTKELYKCNRCDKVFSRQDNLKRHQSKYCNEKNSTNDLKNMLEVMNEKYEIEKKELKDQINLLLNKVGNISVNNTTNNTTINNTIVLNNYGHEDLSHISTALKNKLLKIPYGMIPKIIEHIHFNEEKPENKNIILSNSRDNKIKVFSGNKWVFKDKNETIDDLVDGKYFIMDNHYQIYQNKLTSTQIENYCKFKNLIDNKDKELIENLKKDCELLLLNNR